MTAVLITSPLVIQTTCTTSPEVHEPFYQNREVLKSVLGSGLSQHRALRGDDP